VKVSTSLADSEPDGRMIVVDYSGDTTPGISLLKAVPGVSGWLYLFITNIEIKRVCHNGRLF
jgi:hypothetical protein